MPEGFKLLDAYVEVKADATGIGEKVSKQFAGEIAPAAKKMADAVDTASQRVIAASKRQADAAGALRVAQARLAEVEKTSAEGSTQLVSAQEALAKAQRNVASAAEGADRAQRSLGSAQSRLKESGTSAGSSYLSGLRGSLGSGVVGGLIGGVTSGVTSGIVHLVGAAVSDIGSMLTTVGGMVASTVIDFNSELQNANIGFTTMLGSGAKAKGFLDDLQDFAKSTPFEFGNLVSNAQNMMGMGIAAKDVIPDLRALGDSVASIGGSAAQVDQVTLAFDQMAAKGTLDMGNMNQLMQGGVPSALKIMAAGFHTTTGKMIEMISTGKVQSTVALPMLVKGIEKGTKATAALGGMMDKQSTTFTGALSNIQDGLTQTTAKAFKPFFDVASQGMQRFATALSGKPVAKFTKDVTATLKPFAKAIGDWFKGIDIGKVFSSAGKMLKDAFKGIKPKDLTDGLKDLTGALGNIVKQAPKVIKLIKDMGPAFTATLKQVGDIIGGFSDFVGWLDTMDKTSKKSNRNTAKWFGELVDKFKHGWDQITGFVSGGIHAFAHGADQLNAFFKGVAGFFRDLVGKFGHGWSQIAGFVTGGVKAFQHGADQIVGFFQGIPGAIADVGGQIVSGLVGGLQGAWGAVTSTISDLVNSIPLAVRKLLGIASPSKVFHLIGTQVGQGLHKGLLGSVDQIKVAAGQLADAVTSGFHGANVAKNVAHIHTVAKALERLSTARDKAAGKLSDARSNLADILSQRSDFAAGVKSGVMGNAGPSSIFGTSMQAQQDARQTVLDANAAATPTSAAIGLLNGNLYQPSWTTAPKLAAVPKVSAHAGLLAVKASLKSLLADTKRFAANLKVLTFRGIDPYTYDELVQAGVRGGGLETSAALIADPALSRQIFSLEKQVATAGGKLGGQTAGHEYAGQVASARSAVSRDQRTVNHINVQMVVEAKKIDEVDKLLRMLQNVKQTARKGKK